MKRSTIFAAILPLFICRFAAAQDTGKTAPPDLAIDANAMLNAVVPAFTLRDLQGNVVSIADFRGKVVVLDCWATWCVPCLRSFPSVRQTLDKYKRDTDVVFLFLDTKERVEDYLPLVKKAVADYPEFRVLFDEKGPAGKMDRVFSQFKSHFIPAKFVIDREGIVRFEDIGYMDLPDTELSKKLSEEIEQAKSAGGSR